MAGRSCFSILPIIHFHIIHSFPLQPFNIQRIGKIRTHARCSISPLGHRGWLLTKKGEPMRLCCFFVDGCSFSMDVGFSAPFRWFALPAWYFFRYLGSAAGFHPFRCLCIRQHPQSTAMLMASHAKQPRNDSLAHLQRGRSLGTLIEGLCDDKRGPAGLRSSPVCLAPSCCKKKKNQPDRGACTLFRFIISGSYPPHTVFFFPDNYFLAALGACHSATAQKMG